MFDIGWTELLVVAVVAIIVVGPKDLPGMLRSIGRTVGQLRRMANDFTRQFDEAIRESELHEVRDSVNEITRIDPLADFENSVDRSIDKERRSDSKAALSTTEPDAANDDTASTTTLAQKDSTAHEAQAKSDDQVTGAQGQETTDKAVERSKVSSANAPQTWKVAAGDDSGA